MATKTFPTRIQNMIESAWRYGENAESLTNRINKTKTAKRNKVRYTVRQVAAALAWHTIRANQG
jgi:hypothetical protein